MPTDRASWQLQPPAAGTRVMLSFIALVVPIGTTAAALIYAFQSDDAGLRLVGDSRALTAWLSLGGIVLVSLAVYGLLHVALRRHRLSLADGNLDVATTFYRRTLPVSALRLDQARVVDLDERTELKPLLKTNGTSLPGFKSGWFRLRNRDKALVALAGGKRVVWIPTRAGYALLLQPRHPQALLDALRRMAEPAHGR